MALLLIAAFPALPTEHPSALQPGHNTPPPISEKDFLDLRETFAPCFYGSSACQTWCAKNKEPWTSKCTWDAACAGCSACDSIPKTCDGWCHWKSGKDSWATACESMRCHGCKQCANLCVPPAAPPPSAPTTHGSHNCGSYGPDATAKEIARDEAHIAYQEATLALEDFDATNAMISCTPSAPPEPPSPPFAPPPPPTAPFTYTKLGDGECRQKPGTNIGNYNHGSYGGYAMNIRPYGTTAECPKPSSVAYGNGNHAWAQCICSKLSWCFGYHLDHYNWVWLATDWPTYTAATGYTGTTAWGYNIGLPSPVDDISGTQLYCNGNGSPTGCKATQFNGGSVYPRSGCECYLKDDTSSLHALHATGKYSAALQMAAEQASSASQRREPTMYQGPASLDERGEFLMPEQPEDFLPENGTAAFAAKHHKAVALAADRHFAQHPPAGAKEQVSVDDNGHLLMPEPNEADDEATPLLKPVRELKQVSLVASGCTGVLNNRATLVTAKEDALKDYDTKNVEYDTAEELVGKYCTPPPPSTPPRMPPSPPGPPPGTPPPPPADYPELLSTTGKSGECRQFPGTNTGNYASTSSHYGTYGAYTMEIRVTGTTKDPDGVNMNSATKAQCTALCDLYTWCVAVTLKQKMCYLVTDWDTYTTATGYAGTTQWGYNIGLPEPNTAVNTQLYCAGNGSPTNCKATVFSFGSVYARSSYHCYLKPSYVDSLPYPSPPPPPFAPGAAPAPPPFAYTEIFNTKWSGYERAGECRNFETDRVGSHGEQYGYGNYPFSIGLYAGYSSYKYSGDCKAKQDNWNGHSSSPSYAEEATQVGKCVCDEFDWCLGYQIYYSEIRLITDYPTYHKSLGDPKSFSWGYNIGLPAPENHVGTTLYCAGGSSTDYCKATDFGYGSVYPRTYAHCYMKDTYRATLQYPPPPLPPQPQQPPSPPFAPPPPPPPFGYTKIKNSADGRDGECRQEPGSNPGNYDYKGQGGYSMGISPFGNSDACGSYSNENKHPDTFRAWLKCLCDQYTWCFAFQVQGTRGTLITDYGSYSAVEGPPPTTSWGYNIGLPLPEEKHTTQLYCAGNGNSVNCKATKFGTGSVYSRSGYYCWVKNSPPSPPPVPSSPPPPTTPPPPPTTPPPPPSSMLLKFHTCSDTHAGSNGPIYYSADGGAKIEVDNVGDDRKQGGTDEYVVTYPSKYFSVISDTSDGWCISKIEYGNGKVADLSNAQKEGVWMDKPCTSYAYNRPCTNRINIDFLTGAVTQQTTMQTVPQPLDSPYLKLKTCTISHADTSSGPSYGFSQTSSVKELDNHGVTDFGKGDTAYFYNLDPADAAGFILKATSSNGWCATSIEYIWPSQNINTKADLCDVNKIWFDGPCTKDAYDGVKCAQEIVIDPATGKVQTKKTKTNANLADLCMSAARGAALVQRPSSTGRDPTAKLLLADGHVNEAGEYVGQHPTDEAGHFLQPDDLDAIMDKYLEMAPDGDAPPPIDPMPSA